MRFQLCKELTAHACRLRQSRRGPGNPTNRDINQCRVWFSTWETFGGAKMKPQSFQNAVRTGCLQFPFGGQCIYTTEVMRDGSSLGLLSQGADLVLSRVSHTTFPGSFPRMP